MALRLICSAYPGCGCSHVWSRWCGPLRQICFVQCSPVVKSISVNSEARVLLSLAVGALLWVKSVLWTSEAGLFCCALFGEVGLINLKARD